MRVFITSLILAFLLIPVSAQFTIYFMSANQYETVAGWRLHVVMDMGSMLWPPTGYERTELLLSTMTMGVYEPYAPIATLERRIPERDPEFTLLGKMETNKTWYGRMRIWAGGIVFAISPEFTFVLTEAQPEYTYSGVIPWIVADVWDWNTSLVIVNPTNQPVEGTFTMHYGSGGVVRYPYAFTLGAYKTVSFYVSNLEGDYPGSAGWAVIESDQPLYYQNITVYNDGTTSLSATYAGQLK